MRWWIRSQHPSWAIGSALVGTGVVIALSNSITLPVPSLSGSAPFAGIRLYALVSLLITVITWVSLSAGNKSGTISATRTIRLYVFGSICVIVGICFLLAGVWALSVGGMMVPLQLLLRDLIGLFGLGLAVVPLTGLRYAGIVSTVYVFVSAIFGRSNTGTVAPHDAALWAWPISESPTIDYWIPAIMLFVIGGLIWLLRSWGQHSRIVTAQAMDTRRE